jgi:hypothetical protein
LEPNEIKWQLMIASCYRRLGAFQQSYEVYLEIHRKHEDNVECLRYLIQICNDLGLQDQVNEFVRKLTKAESSSWGKEPKENASDSMVNPRLPSYSNTLQSMKAGSRAREDENLAKAYDPSVMARPSTAGMRKFVHHAEDFGEGLSDELLPL